MDEDRIGLVLINTNALQQQQWYEKEAALAEIQNCQKKLLKELKEYKGKSFQVIHEAMAFATETEDKNDLRIQPNNLQESEREKRQSGLGGAFKSFKVLLGKAAKTAKTEERG